MKSYNLCTAARGFIHEKSPIIVLLCFLNEIVSEFGVYIVVENQSHHVTRAASLCAREYLDQFHIYVLVNNFATVVAFGKIFGPNLWSR